MGRTLARFKVWWNAAIDALDEIDGPAQRWGDLTDDSLLHLSYQPEGLVGIPRAEGGRISLETDDDIRRWLASRGLLGSS